MRATDIFSLIAPFAVAAIGALVVALLLRNWLPASGRLAEAAWVLLVTGSTFLMLLTLTSQGRGAIADAWHLLGEMLSRRGDGSPRVLS